MEQRKEIALKGYYVFSNGDVFHGDRKLKYSLDKDGYKQMNITHKGKSYHYKIHRLVAKAFIDNPNNLPEVNHIDGDKGNNDVSNLEWCTHAENLHHASKNKLFRYGENHQNSKLTQKQADEIRTLYKTSKYRQRDIACMFGTTPMVVNRIVNNKTYLGGQKCSDGL